jgi:A/G-specific adenine glycosylase
MLPAMKAKPNPRAAIFRRRLTAWFRRAGRDLPWRRTRDPWAIVVSEFMLQQTQVSRVLGYYPRFLERYPTPHHLARARPAAVREAWDGLGYYRRAANLQVLAKVVVKDHAGRLPHETAALEQLPGVGRYTAGAVACFAYEKPAATVDTNVARVLSRVWGKTGRRADARPRNNLRQLQELALELQPRAGKAAWTFNQALMELGALVCTARNPRCESCPVKKDCDWKARQKQN